MMKLRGAAVGAIFLATIALAGVAVHSNSSAAAGQIAILSGTSGSISTLDCYDLPTPFRAHWLYSAIDDPFAPCNSTDNHPADGVTGAHARGLASPVDTAAGSGSAVWLQVDYLPNGLSGGISGGFVYVYKVYSACSQYSPTDAEYNGKKVQVDILYYDRFEAQINGNSVIYEHFDTNGNVAANAGSAYTIAWNNANASQKLWSPQIEVFKMNNTTAGGLGIGGVAQTGASSPASCSGGNHLHQEVGGGQYNPYDYWGKSATARYSDSHYLTLSGIVGTAP